MESPGQPDSGTVRLEKLEIEDAELPSQTSGREGEPSGLALSQKLAALSLTSFSAARKLPSIQAPAPSPTESFLHTGKEVTDHLLVSAASEIWRSEAVTAELEQAMAQESLSGLLVAEECVIPEPPPPTPTSAASRMASESAPLQDRALKVRRASLQPSLVSVPEDKDALEEDGDATVISIGENREAQISHSFRSEEFPSTLCSGQTKQMGSLLSGVKLVKLLAAETEGKDSNQHNYSSSSESGAARPADDEFHSPDEGKTPKKEVQPQPKSSRGLLPSFFRYWSAGKSQSGQDEQHSATGSGEVQSAAEPAPSDSEQSAKEEESGFESPKITPKIGIAAPATKYFEASDRLVNTLDSPAYLHYSRSRLKGSPPLDNSREGRFTPPSSGSESELPVQNLKGTLEKARGRSHSSGGEACQFSPVPSDVDSEGSDDERAAAGGVRIRPMLALDDVSLMRVSGLQQEEERQQGDNKWEVREKLAAAAEHIERCNQLKDLVHTLHGVTGELTASLGCSKATELTLSLQLREAEAAKGHSNAMMLKLQHQAQALLDQLKYNTDAMEDTRMRLSEAEAAADVGRDASNIDFHLAQALKRNQAMGTRCTELCSENIELQKQVSYYSAQANTTSSAVQEAQDRLAELEVELKELGRENNDLRGVLEGLLQAHPSGAQVPPDNEASSPAMPVLLKELLNARLAVQSLESDVRTLQLDLAVSIAGSASAAPEQAGPSAVQGPGSGSASSGRHVPQAFEKRHQDFSQLMRIVKSLTEHSNMLEKQVSQLSKSVGCKALEVSRLKDRCIRLTGSNEQLRSENEGLRQMIVDIKADLRKMEQEATCVEGDAQQLIKSLAAAQQRATRKAAECTALRDRLKAADENVAEAWRANQEAIKAAVSNALAVCCRTPPTAESRSPALSPRLVQDLENIPPGRTPGQQSSCKDAQEIKAGVANALVGLEEAVGMLWALPYHLPDVQEHSTVLIRELRGLQEKLASVLAVSQEEKEAFDRAVTLTQLAAGAPEFMVKQMHAAVDRLFDAKSDLNEAFAGAERLLAGLRAAPPAPDEGSQATPGCSEEVVTHLRTELAKTKSLLHLYREAHKRACKRREAP